jgi:dipeptidyl aminopeptidase/acylaminoacyl peptidase
MLWLEGRPQEGGRNVLCQYNSGGKNVDVSPADLNTNIRTRVHEYGGGSVVVGESMEQLFVSDFGTQQLCQLEVVPDDASSTTTTTSTLKPIPTHDVSTNQYRFADGVYHQGTIYCVREDHGPNGDASPQEVQNAIVAVNVASGTMTVLASGNDFYAAPRVSTTSSDSDGDGDSDRNTLQVAYITWNHPNMPWDATELRVVTVLANEGDACVIQGDEHIAGGVNGDDSIMQPLWHPTSGDLFYLSDESGYYNLYKKTKESPAEPPKRIWTLHHDLGGSAPGWSLGQQGYTFLPQDGRLAAVYQNNGKSVLVLANVSDADSISNIQEYGTDDGLPMMFGSLTPASQTTELYFVGGSPSTPTSLYKWNWKQDEDNANANANAAELLVCSSSQTYDEGLISVPKQVEFPTTGGRTAFGYYYPPKNHAYKCTTDSSPPLLVKAHGGPTACTGTAFQANIQFWTSRGVAILDVDYGGSTGYGREYRRRLRGSWGIVDIDDVCNGAQYLVEQGLADGNRLCIDGGSAGGYTTLGALAFRDVFHAGCSLYGVADLTALAGDTHKFESRYLDGLVGKYPEDEAIYKERSPIESVEQLSCPILLLQGDEDKIVPPNQAEMMHEALLKKGIPTCIKIYKGEQHGFRKAENIEDALDSELAFYGKVFGINVPGAVELKIDNLKE